MIMARKQSTSTPRWRRAFVLLSVMMVLPVGFVVAQDFEAIERRLAEGVLEGELSLQQAAVMIDVLRRNAENRDDPRRHSSSDRGAFRREEYARAKKRIDEMVAEGKMSREDADRRLGEMRRRISRDREERGRNTGTMTRQEYANGREAIEKMVVEGKVSREDADRRLGEMRRRISRDREERGRNIGTMTRQEYASGREAIEKMVAEGKVSREDADRRLGEMRRAIGSQQRKKGDSRRGEKGVEPRLVPEEEYKRVEAELKKQVEEAGRRRQGE